MQPPPASSPPMELRLDFSTDFELSRIPRERKKSLPEEQKLRDKSPGVKKSKDRSNRLHENGAHASPVTTPDDEEKGLLGGLLRFRTRSKERKAAAKQALQQIAESRTRSPAPKPQTPPPLPIAERFARLQKEDVSFRHQVQESESSHGGTTSVGHTGTSPGDPITTSQGSADTHDVYPRPRDRSSRYARPHPVWRSGPASTVGRNPTVASGEGSVTLPPERHAYPPNQTIFDREPVKAPINNPTGTPVIDMEAVNKYYGITPVATIPSAPSPQSRFALTQALAPVESNPQEDLSTPRLTPGVMTPVSPSPFIVPSPDPTQVDFGVRKREKPGRMNKPPALNPTHVASRRKMAQFIPPPTPPPTMELPPIPTDVPLPLASLRPPLTSPLAARSPSPNMRMGSASPLPPRDSDRFGVATQENRNERQNSPMRSASTYQRAASPVQRGKTPAFPMRPITPTRPISPTKRPQGQAPLRQEQVYVPSRRQGSDPSEMARPRRSSLNEQDLAPLRPDIRAEQDTLQPVAIPRRRSTRRSNNQSGYDSDETASRYSRDTYYGRETAYFDDQNMPPLPGVEEPLPPLPRDFGNLEQERKAGRERLLQFLASRED